jgi:hypothetical protein
MLLAALAFSTFFALPDTIPQVRGLAAVPALSDSIALGDTVRRRHSVSYSDAYAVRLRIHRIGSYTMLPLFAAEYGLGQNLLNDSRPSSWIQPTHTSVALGIGALFTVNTVTGLWNLWDSRNDPADRTRRWIHTSLMMASNAGFVWTRAIGGDSHTSNQRQRHKTVALSSMAVSAAGTVMMWLWKT